jgi:putative chitinase
MISVTREQILRLASDAKPNYLDAFVGADEMFARYGINANARRLSHFLAQVLHESGNLTVLTESMNYPPQALLATFGQHRITPEQARQLGRSPGHPAKQEAIANVVYGGEFGRVQLGNTQVGDGWRFRGHAAMQMTGRDSFQRIGKRMGVDFVSNPELSLQAPYILLTACEEWSEKRCNEVADANDIVAVTKRINGGRIGLPQREAQFARTSAVWR